MDVKKRMEEMGRRLCECKQREYEERVEKGVIFVCVFVVIVVGGRNMFFCLFLGGRIGVA